MSEIEEAGLKQVRGVHVFFRTLVAAAGEQASGVTYKTLGQEFAMRSALLLEERVEGHDDEDPELCYEELLDFVAAEDDDGVWRWFRMHFPRHAKLIPRKKRLKFIDGVFEALSEVLSDVCNDCHAKAHEEIPHPHQAEAQ